MFEMIPIVGLSWAGKLFAAAVSVAVVFVLLRVWDRRAGIEFPLVMEGIRRVPTAVALYLGLRVLAVCILVGLVGGFS